MEESSERRRERLRALRDEASLANNDEERGGSCVSSPWDHPPGLPFPGDMQQVPASASPSPRFEFYTDPLAAFSSSQKKKPKNSVGSPFSGGPPPPACKSPPSPFWQPDFNPNFLSLSNVNPNAYPNLHPPGSFSTPNPPNPNPNPNQYSTGNFISPNAKSFSPNQSRTSGKFASPGSFSTPASTDFNPNMALQGGYNHPGSSSLNPLSGFGSPQPFSASQTYNGVGRGSSNTPAPNQYTQERGGFSTDSPPQHRSGGSGRQNNWRAQNGMYSGRSQQGSNRSWGSGRQSPGSSGRGNRTSGWSSAGGRGFQRASHEASAVMNPELFAKRSMLLDPWKDLMPVRFESVAARINACSDVDSRDWLPKSVSKGIASPSMKGVTIAASGPSLAESLAASYADAVLEEDGA